MLSKIIMWYTYYKWLYNKVGDNDDKWLYNKVGDNDDKWLYINKVGDNDG